jgi:hypothetical protein
MIRDAILIVIITVIAYLLFTPMGEGAVRYDCSIAEVSPDFTTEMREQCRHLRMEKAIGRDRS